MRKAKSMSTDVIEKINQLPPDKQKEVENFINSLFDKYKSELQEKGNSVAEIRRKNMGWAKGQIWIADDFNKTPEDFKDYL